ncbi:Protein FAR1-RELATED SEQUENCE 5 [Dendrobium catenatum]|uniref:Protein FAR1-RELATED SEQUENCE 5 n=1 Tax=Dendrobium catenatum TaxID=906689 RepID=A0A2I0X2J6_9ASPA|nr:Protein FAR1-RELATED SEQUENCE 5 [Dendrobium catenatum]
MKDFLYSKAGFKKGLDLNAKSKYRKANTRTGCPAMIRFSVDQEGECKVNKCIENHNHELARPEDQHLLRSCRKITEERAFVLKSMADAGIRTIDAFTYLADEVGDAYNFVQRNRRCKIETGDKNSLIEIFKNRAKNDNMFVWEVQYDEEDRLMNFFWADGVGRIDYDCFGDIIIFDTSYRLNKYNLACAPFVGVNNHWQNVLLGVAFLSEETVESFTWLFRTFLRVMGGKHPITIFTDQDQAMSHAIQIAFPQTRHRLCQWHIMKKLPSKVHCYNSNNKVRGLIYKCFSKCDSEEEFESTWTEMLNEGDLHSHEWLKELHKIRHKWSTTYNKTCFNLGILSTQRSESTNNVCHGISKPTSTITECFLGLEKVMKTWRRNEKDEDFKCSQSDVVPLVKSSPILRQAARFYSRKLYSFFEEEFLQGVGGMCITQASTDLSTFFVKTVENIDQPRHWTVNFDDAEGSIECSCGKFGMMGILCSHYLRVIRRLDIINIPPKYLLKRWSGRARKDLYSNRPLSSMVATGCPSDGIGSMIFKNYFTRFAYQISSRGEGNTEAEQYMIDAMYEIVENVDLILNASKDSNLDTNSSMRTKIKDPIKRRPKGVSNARLKSYWEKRKPKRKKAEEQPTPSTHQPTPVEHSSQVYFANIPEYYASTQQPTPAEPSSQVSFANIPDYFASTHQQTHVERFGHVPFLKIPECFTDEWLLRRPTSQPNPKYLNMMNEFIDAERLG